ncbi:MAG: multidrug transporter, partial [Sphingobacteriales bacterium]
MHTGRRYNLSEFILWTRTTIYRLLLLSVVPVFLYEVVGWKWLAIPWVPVTLIGTAAAFITGFKNTQTYSRSWEARQIWGGIVNTSRAFGVAVKNMVRGQDEAGVSAMQQQLIYRHIGWLTALRFQLRESRVWENIKSKSYNTEYKSHYKVDEWDNELATELTPYLTADEKDYILSKKNRATQIISLQSVQLKELNEAGNIDTLNYVEIQNLLKEFYEHQGKCERIKNFPYPRQFASINTFFIWLFVLMVPFGLMQEFAKLGEGMVWLSVPFSIL